MIICDDEGQKKSVLNIKYFINVNDCTNIYSVVMKCCLNRIIVYTPKNMLFLRRRITLKT